MIWVILVYFGEIFIEKSESTAMVLNHISAHLADQIGWHPLHVWIVHIRMLAPRRTLIQRCQKKNNTVRSIYCVK